jgi:hypothetical protein
MHRLKRQLSRRAEVLRECEKVQEREPEQPAGGFWHTTFASEELRQERLTRRLALLVDLVAADSKHVSQLSTIRLKGSLCKISQADI